MLQGPLDLALATPEVDWSAPRPPEWILGGAWGSQRTIMFSGKYQDQGIPPRAVSVLHWVVCGYGVWNESTETSRVHSRWSSQRTVIPQVGVVAITWHQCRPYILLAYVA